MSTKRKYADTDVFTSESSLDHSDNTDMNDQEAEHEIDIWASLKMKAEENMTEFAELTKIFTADGLEEEARDKAYLTILPKLRKDLQSICLDRLLWIAQMKKGPIHKQIQL